MGLWRFWGGFYGSGTVHDGGGTFVFFFFFPAVLYDTRSFFPFLFFSSFPFVNRNGSVRYYCDTSCTPRYNNSRFRCLRWNCALKWWNGNGIGGGGGGAGNDAFFHRAIDCGL